MADNNVDYELYYFDARGLGEPIRYILKLKDISFKDIRVPMDPMPPTIPSEVARLCRFGQVPVLKMGEKLLTQSRAICRFLSKKHDLVGKDDFEAATCDEFVDAAFDYWQMWMASFTAQDEDKKAELRKVAEGKGRDRYLKSYNDILSSKDQGNGPVYLVGDGLTWTDLYVANVLDNIQRAFEVDVLTEFPTLHAWSQNVFDTPKIKEYIQERPPTKY